MSAADAIRIRPCVKCGVEKVIGIQCKPCKARIKARSYLKNSEKNIAYSRKWALENPEKCKIASAKYRLNNPEKRKTSASKWRLKNLDIVNKKNSKWALENPEKIKEISARWAAKNPEHRKNYQKKARLNLSDAYVASKLKLSVLDAPTKLIELKRVQLQITRALREINK